MAERARRHRGEGSVYQRKDGRWVGVVDLGYIGDKRVRRTVTAPTLAKLTPRLRKLKQDVAAGMVTDDATVEQWLTHWLDNIAAERVRPSTLATYRHRTRNWIVPHLGKIKISKLKPDHLRAFYRTLRDAGLSDGSRHGVHAILHRALVVAERDGRIPFNPAARIDPPSRSKTTHGKLTLSEARAVLAQLDGRDDAARWACALLQGIRQGEALGLRWEDVDLELGTIYVRRTALRLKGQGMVVGPLKTVDSERVIPMLGPVHTALSLMPRREGFVFGDGDTPINSRRDWQAWSDLLRAAGVEHRPPHAARATTGSLLDEAGVSPKTIAEILGHGQVATTQRHYIQGDSRIHRNAMTSLEALVFGDHEAKPEPVVSAVQHVELPAAAHDD